MTRLDLPTVRLVREDRSHHFDPPLDQDWTADQKIAWQAAIVAEETGLTISVFTDAWIVDGQPVPGSYAITVGHSSHSALAFAAAWTFLNGVSTGAVALRTEQRMEAAEGESRTS